MPAAIEEAAPPDTQAEDGASGSKRTPQGYARSPLALLRDLEALADKRERHLRELGAVLEPLDAPRPT
jgi:hypothetical protein